VALVAGFLAFAFLEPPLGPILFAVGATLEIGETYLWYRYLNRIRVKTGAEGLIGTRASVIEACEPRGTVKVAGEIWAAECEEGAGVGETVAITAVDGLLLVVEVTGEPPL
jgi:membrane protein implicated in regulation of membrane protease activity